VWKALCSPLYLAKQQHNYTLPLGFNDRKMQDMEKREVKQIADDIKDLEEGLVEWDYRGLSTLGHLNRLHLIGLSGFAA
jgi:uncharacterized protein (DUF927 family)